MQSQLCELWFYFYFTSSLSNLPAIWSTRPSTLVWRRTPRFSPRLSEMQQRRSWLLWEIPRPDSCSLIWAALRCCSCFGSSWLHWKEGPQLCFGFWFFDGAFYSSSCPIFILLLSLHLDLDFMECFVDGCSQCFRSSNSLICCFYAIFYYYFVA